LLKGLLSSPPIVVAAAATVMLTFNICWNPDGRWV